MPFWNFIPLWLTLGHKTIEIRCIFYILPTFISIKNILFQVGEILNMMLGLDCGGGLYPSFLKSSRAELLFVHEGTWFFTNDE